MFNMLLNVLTVIALAVLAVIVSVTDTPLEYWKCAFDYYSCWVYVRSAQLRTWIVRRIRHDSSASA
jgi:hypothetical protein